MAAPIHLVGLSIHHPGARDREAGNESRITLGVRVGQSPTVRDIELDEAALLKLLRDGTNYLAILRGVR
jgi:hypothetical protein